MKIEDLMEIVHTSYPDEFTRNYWDAKKKKPKRGSGDTLAEFIVREVFEAYSEGDTDHNQLVEAERVMLAAARELSAVARAFDKRAMKIARALTEPK